MRGDDEVEMGVMGLIWVAGVMAMNDGEDCDLVVAADDDE